MTREELSALVSYNPDTGAIRLAEAPDALGWVNAGGYHVVSLLGKDVYVHRIAIALTHNVWPEAVDHINGDKLDNRLCNLRIATRQENLFNSRCRADSRSGVKGVSRHGSGWRAKIKRDGVTHCLGTFATIAEASQAYRSAAAKLHGNFAFNGPDNAAVRAAKALLHQDQRKD